MAFASTPWGAEERLEFSLVCAHGRGQLQFSSVDQRGTGPVLKDMFLQTTGINGQPRRRCGGRRDLLSFKRLRPNPKTQMLWGEGDSFP